MSINLTEERAYARAISDDLQKVMEGTYTNDDGEEVDLYDYLNAEVLDVEYILNSDFTLRGVRLYVTLGGPTAWIDTERDCVVCHWGTNSGEWLMPYGVSDEINDLYAELIADRFR